MIETTKYEKCKIEQKGMTSDHDFGYSPSRFSFLLNKRKQLKKKAKIVIKSHEFLLDQM